MSFTGHAALLFRPHQQGSDIKAATLPGKTSAAHWLKGSTLATLSLGVQGIEHLLTIYIRDQAVIQCSSVLCTILSPEDTGQGWVLLGAPTSSQLYQVISNAHIAVGSLTSSGPCHCAHSVYPQAHCNLTLMMCVFCTSGSGLCIQVCPS